ncbi:DUF3667 domain-containing protein [Pleionea litopenaei]|uniref:DUF3667 domain-containing protein n=1 Tax=Pleionea litopenaei TaxID=3070815 RepID=A0AA51X5E2_9GAMM|nr:DUF3667 domain-containing protein [Pleionea sp. HL-JVS1]WMS85659.1 DUF3667 domain-containing protein [Pleionea sp. HL-JVS1]
MSHNLSEDTSLPISCPSCGYPISLRYCSRCGEERLRPELRSVFYLLKQFLEDITSVDGKIGSTLQLMLLKPGQFELNFYQGRRVDFLRPITFFLLINVLFVFLSPITDFYVTFVDQLTLQPYSGWIKEWTLNKIAAMGATPNEFKVHYDQLVKVLARSLIILQVPIFAVFSYFICYRKSYYFADHLIFSLNLHAWLLIWIVAAQVPEWVILTFADLFGFRESVAGIYFLLLPIGLIAYMAAALRRFWRFNWWSVAIRVVALMFAFQVAHSIFRLTQFFLTFYMVQMPEMNI